MQPVDAICVMQRQDGPLRPTVLNLSRPVGIPSFHVHLGADVLVHIGVGLGGRCLGAALVRLAEMPNQGRDGAYGGGDGDLNGEAGACMRSERTSHTSGCNRQQVNRAGE